MSGYETKAKPILRAMMIGPAIPLGVETQILLREYFAFKLMVLDWTNEDPVFTQEERTAFYENRTLPSGVQFMIAQCLEPTMQSYYRTHFLQAADKDKLAGQDFGQKNVKTFAVGFGGIFIFALCVRGDGATLSLQPRPFWLRIMPEFSPSYFWPPLRSISRAEAELVATSLNALKGNEKVRLADTVDDLPIP